MRSHKSTQILHQCWKWISTRWHATWITVHSTSSSDTLTRTVILGLQHRQAKHWYLTQLSNSELVNGIKITRNFAVVLDGVYHCNEKISASFRRQKKYLYFV